MRKVVWISRCHSKALQRTRSLLDKYAIRVGERTWKAEVTEEGLQTIRKELASMATRQTAVACHVIEDGHLRLLWVVGRRSRFGPEGEVRSHGSFRGRDPRRGDQGFAGAPLLTTLAESGGLAHDLGKDTVRFQEKLTVGIGAPVIEPWRHEIVSIERLSTIDDSITFPPKSADRAGVMAILARLVATHHDLPKKPGSWEKSHGPTRYPESVQPATTENPPLGGRVLLERDSELRGRLSNRLADLGSYETPGGVGEAAFFWSRLALMIGDHYASSGGREGQLKRRQNPRTTGVYAKSPDEYGEQLDLSDHVRDVARSARRAAALLPHLESVFPGLESEQRTTIERRSPKRFAWQNELVDLIRRQHSTPEGRTAGNFVVLAAGTGSGKTRAGAKAAVALAGNRPARWATLLGLRSLTLQTGDAYREELGLDPAEVTTLIGSREIRRLHEAGDPALNEDRAEESVTGDGGEIVSHGTPPPRIPRLLEPEVRNNDQARLLGSPVLVATVDYLMGVADAGKTTQVLPSLRLRTSDVILDEIDDYSIDDQAALARLVFAVGLYGRNLILSSATASPEVIKPLAQAYTAGWQCYAALAGTNPAVNALFAADNTKGEAEVAGDAEALSAAYARFADRVGRRAAEAAEKAPRRRGAIVDEPLGAEDPPWASIQALHANQAVDADRLGLDRVSVGVVRIANVNELGPLAEAMARFDTLDAETGLVVIPYHARQPLLVRSLIERHLDRMLKRKPGDAGEDPLLDDPFIRDQIEQVTARGLRNLCVVVVASPVEEVGRDHDFDWALIEPSSTRSIIQLAGRVRRHRGPLKTREPNLLIANRNRRSLRGEKVALTRPGFEHEQSPLPTHAMSDLLGTDSPIVRSPSAKALLAKREALDKEARLPAYERERMQKYLETAATVYETFRQRTTHQHAQTYPFRGGPEGVKVVWSPVNGFGYESRPPKKRPFIDYANTRFRSVEDPLPGLFPAQGVIEEEVGRWCEEGDSRCYERWLSTQVLLSRDKGVSEQTRSYYAHPVLGVYRDPEAKG